MPENETTTDRFSRTYQTGEIILCEFVPGEEMFIIVSGHVKICKITKSSEKVLALLSPGDIIGEMAVINRKLRSATAVATEPTKVIGLTADNFEQFIAKKPQLLVKLVQILCDRIWFTARQVQNFSLKTASGRITGMLTLLGENHQKKPEQNSNIQIYTSPQDLSYMTGLELREAEGILKGFERKEYLKIEEGLIVINDLNKIRTSAEFDTKREQFSSL
ncbi:MAG TPA: hypothetical protein DDW65_13665 [Firmicutes bacterium]|jgi:CRP/FNR family transcriptional regulator, cyclic AMP receptor protein|nr:hypothetical protein [Bacillota bacterium]